MAQLIPNVKGLILLGTKNLKLIQNDTGPVKPPRAERAPIKKIILKA